MAEGGGTAPAEPGLSLEVAPIHKGKRAQSVRGASMVPTDTGGEGATEPGGEGAAPTLEGGALGDGAVEQPPSPMALLKPVYLAIFVDTMGIAITIPVLPYYALAFGISATELGLLMTAYSGAQAVGALGMGVLSDRLGRRLAIQLSFLGSAIGFALSALATSYPFLIAARIVGGLSGGSMPVAQAFIADVVPPKDRAKYIGLTGATVGIAFTLGPGIGALLTVDAIDASPKLIFWLAAAFSIVSLLYASLRMTEGTKRAEAAEGKEEAAAGLSATQLSLLLARFATNCEYSSSLAHFHKGGSRSLLRRWLHLHAVHLRAAPPRAVGLRLLHTRFRPPRERIRHRHRPRSRGQNPVPTLRACRGAG